MTKITEAKTIKELEISSNEAKNIAKLFKGSKTEPGLSARVIAEQTGIPRRKVMRALEIQGLTNFASGSYA